MNTEQETMLGDQLEHFDETMQPTPGWISKLMGPDFMKAEAAPANDVSDFVPCSAIGTSDKGTLK